MKPRRWVIWAAAAFLITLIPATALILEGENNEVKRVAAAGDGLVPEDHKTLLDVPHLEQGDKYPSGCESVSAVMALRYMGADITVEEFIDCYLEKGSLETINGVLQGPSPDECFVGDPYSELDYGCYAPVIVEAFRDIEQATGIHARNASGRELESLVKESVDQGFPLLIWTTIGMEPSRDGTSWTLEETGEPFTWTAGEHCLVLTGYDNDSYYFNDPLDPYGGVSYPKELVKNGTMKWENRPSCCQSDNSALRLPAASSLVMESSSLSAISPL